ncbi:hypothetical protein QQ045_024534 [Rhodiola kirilowii]
MENLSGQKKTRQYHPYQDLQIPIQKLYELPTAPEYLFDEEARQQRRSVTENLQYYTGSAYLAGAIVGGAKGTLDGLGAAERGDTLKLRINRVLNSGGSTGRRFGNTLGVLGLIYGGLESAANYYRDSDDSLNSFMAGLGTGALYRAASGPRSAVIAGAIGGITAATAVTGKQMLKRYLPI